MKSIKIYDFLQNQQLVLLFPGNTLTRIVQTRYGKLQGFVKTMNPARNLKPIEVFLGVPYATPPVGSNRFAPTRAAMPWDGVRLSTSAGPACPQKLPRIK